MGLAAAQEKLGLAAAREKLGLAAAQETLGLAAAQEKLQQRKNLRQTALQTPGFEFPSMMQLGLVHEDCVADAHLREKAGRLKFGISEPRAPTLA